ncbi:hypothetical protein Sme01_01680 [Sphaerisporangium melleum]|uniref:Expansin-like EG45 domain-containing protein n=1 Tax=Sphaerisporangium melleum TaxID=321316 RepID=A0A917R3P3_9ACTN|nr:expansin EXLX1 family cellulose-binding protein [Sphaerisporangium melleum]GGK88504.1 hypothetical protein GCM10007964_34010 [Sphaerisporangium melleum]GII67692.1 hypothetical protein Sme01_01680 [Sphaerisporangium melleum]
MEADQRHAGPVAPRPRLRLRRRPWLRPRSWSWPGQVARLWSRARAGGRRPAHRAGGGRPRPEAARPWSGAAWSRSGGPGGEGRPPRGAGWHRLAWALSLGTALTLVLLGAQTGRDAACAAAPGPDRPAWLVRMLGGGCSLSGAVQDDLVASVSPAEYAGSAACGAYLDVTGPRGTVRVQVVDQCRSCPAGELDLSRRAFARITGPGRGVVPVGYHRVRNPEVPRPVAFRLKQGSSARRFAIQAIDHGNPLRLVQMLQGGRWLDLTRTFDNHWILPGRGAGPGPYTVRVTDVYGQRLVAGGIRLIPGRLQRTEHRLYAPSAATPAPSVRGTAARRAAGGTAPRLGAGVPGEARRGPRRAEERTSQWDANAMPPRATGGQEGTSPDVTGRGSADRAGERVSSPGGGVAPSITGGTSAPSGETTGGRPPRPPSASGGTAAGGAWSSPAGAAPPPSGGTARDGMRADGMPPGAPGTAPSASSGPADASRTPGASGRSRETASAGSHRVPGAPGDGPAGRVAGAARGTMDASPGDPRASPGRAPLTALPSARPFFC